MYAKIFSQIFDSSIAGNYEVRHFFEDMLKLCDSDGVVDMTAEAISRRTNVPLEKVKFGLQKLSEEDPESRSKNEGGRRLIALDSNRNWGWIVVNYAHYRKIVDEESRREYFRNAKRKERAKRGKRGKALVAPTGVTAAKIGADYGQEAQDQLECQYEAELEEQRRDNKNGEGI